MKNKNSQEAFLEHKIELKRKIKRMRMQIINLHATYDSGINRSRVNSNILTGMLGVLVLLKDVEAEIEKNELPKSDILFNPEKYDGVFGTDEEIKMGKGLWMVPLAAESKVNDELLINKEFQTI